MRAAIDRAETEHFSQETLDRLRKKTDGAFLITGRRGLGGNYPRKQAIIYLALQTSGRSIAAPSYSLASSWPPKREGQ